MLFGITRVVITWQFTVLLRGHSTIFITAMTASARQHSISPSRSLNTMSLHRVHFFSPHRFNFLCLYTELQLCLEIMGRFMNSHFTDDDNCVWKSWAGSWTVISQKMTSVSGNHGPVHEQSFHRKWHLCLEIMGRFMNSHFTDDDNYVWKSWAGLWTAISQTMNTLTTDCKGKRAIVNHRLPDLHDINIHTPVLVKDKSIVLNFMEPGARCSSVVRAFAHGEVGRWIDP